MYYKSLLPKCGKFLVALSTAVVTLTACQDDLGDDSHYKAPSFLAGNALQVLEKSYEGHTFNTFLRGIELVGYNDVVDSQILTVLAPTDEAFAAFLREKAMPASRISIMPIPPTPHNSLPITFYIMRWIGTR